MSTEHLIKTRTFPRSFQEMTSTVHHIFLNKLQCIICHATIDLNTKEHKCVLRQQHKDIIIRNRYL